eukprot:1152981-Prymnesium_polylepis.1
MDLCCRATKARSVERPRHDSPAELYGPSRLCMTHSGGLLSPLSQEAECAPERGNVERKSMVCSTQLFYTEQQSHATPAAAPQHAVCSPATHPHRLRPSR